MTFKIICEGCGKNITLDKDRGRIQLTDYTENGFVKRKRLCLVGASYDFPGCTFCNACSEEINLIESGNSRNRLIKDIAFVKKKNGGDYSDLLKPKVEKKKPEPKKELDLDLALSGIGHIQKNNIKKGAL